MARFAASLPGRFAGGATCTLAPSAPAAASCAVRYVPTARGKALITADYRGDATHTASHGATHVWARLTAAQEPLRVTQSSLVQSGQQLIWSLRTARPFWLENLGKQYRSLCLLLWRPRYFELCVWRPTGPGARAWLLYTRFGSHGPVSEYAIQGTITRTSLYQLSATFLPGAAGLGYQPVTWQTSSGVYTTACAPDPQCRVLYPRRPIYTRLHVPQPIGCVPSGSPFVYSGASNQPEIALTFDDGPWYDTSQFLGVLESRHVVATFFQIGKQISTYGPGVEQRMLADGDMIGDHTWDHADVSGGGDFARWEISSTAQAIYGATGFTPCLFRAPYGSISGSLISQARSMGFTTIQWDVDPSDWSRPGADAIYNNVVGNAHNGAIVIQHDGGGDRSETLAALPREIDTLRSWGYRFVTVTQLLGQTVTYR